jgi:hypothetical protein
MELDRRRPGVPIQRTLFCSGVIVASEASVSLRPLGRASSVWARSTSRRSIISSTTPASKLIFTLIAAAAHRSAATPLVSSALPRNTADAIVPGKQPPTATGDARDGRRGVAPLRRTLDAPREDHRLLTGRGQFVADLSCRACCTPCSSGAARARSHPLDRCRRRGGDAGCRARARRRGAAAPVAGGQLSLPAKWRNYVQHTIHNPQQPMLAVGRSGTSAKRSRWWWPRAPIRL